jgi:hypothetical protein
MACSHAMRAHPNLRRSLLLLLAAVPVLGMAHGVSTQDAGFVAGVEGVHFGPFTYLGAKHMVTGYDHLAFLAGVIFLLRNLRDVALYASLFALGHTVTLLGAVLAGLQVDAHLVDAVIGLSVVYKGFENIGGFRNLGWALDPRAAVLGFGLVHGLGLATKVQDLQPSPDGLAANLIAFNLGVELGQLAIVLVLFPVLFALRRLSVYRQLALPLAAAAMIVISIGWVFERAFDVELPRPGTLVSTVRGVLS